MPSFGRISVTAPGDLSSFSRQVVEVMAKYTSFAWPILAAQCRRANIEPGNLDKDSLLKLLPFIVQGVGAFTSPEKAKMVGAALWRLAYSQ